MQPQRLGGNNGVAAICRSNLALKNKAILAKFDCNRAQFSGRSRKFHDVPEERDFPSWSMNLLAF
jgi:hypothetical protein